jgi:hypothetical protein
MRRQHKILIIPSDKLKATHFLECLRWNTNIFFLWMVAVMGDFAVHFKVHKDYI